jgi:putative ABC transport system ATP-binding protein
VAIARALITKPKIILADEPTGALDSKTSVEVMQLLKQLNEDEHITQIIVTHDPTVAEQTKRIIRISDGVISK